MQPAGWGSLGFKQLRTKDEQSGVLTTTTYRQDWPFNGRPWKTIVRSKQGKTLRDAENTWAIHNWNNTWPTTAKTGTAKLGALQVYLKTATERSYALQGNGSTQGALLQTVTTTTSYDNYGNATRINSVTKNGSNTTVQTRTVSNNYGTGSYNLFHGRLQSSTAATTRNGVTHTRKSAFSYYTTGTKKGLLKTETIQPEGGKAFKLTTTHLYDSFGNKTQTTTTGWDGTATVTRQSARSEYDSTGRFVDKQYQRYPGKGEQLVSKVVKRNRYGSPTQATDTNGVNAYNYYTALGRLYFATSDLGGWKKTWTGSTDTLCPTGTAYTAYVEQAGGAAAKECFDVLARSTRKLSQGFDGRWIATDQSYDNFGRADISSEPFFIYNSSNSATHWTQIKSYDLLGRPTKLKAPDNSISTTTYNGLTTTSTNAAKQAKTEVRNVLGEVTQVTDNLGGTTRYSYDPSGNLTTMTDHANNRTTIAYDVLGRKTRMSDPDKGNWRYDYNAFGELIQQTDGKGQISTLRYDTLGRLTQRTDKRADNTVEQTATWTYDSQPKGLGKAATETDSNGYRRVFSYDRYGRNNTTTTTLPGLGSYSQRQTFDHFGRIFQTFDASSGKQHNGNRGLQTRYNRYGFAYEVIDVRHKNQQPKTTYQSILAMDARGNVTQSRQGSGVTTIKAYNAATGLLESVNSQRTLLGDIQNLEYHWSNIGNLQYRIESSGTKNLREDFHYDKLNRLTRATTQSNGTTRTQSLSYNLIGNITYKSDVGNYSYGAGTAGPHAVTTANGKSYTYDANGNNLTGDGRSLTYSTFDKVLTATKGQHRTTFTYGPDRSRYKRVDTNSQTGQTKTTWYLGSVEIIDYSSGRRDYKRQLGMALETLSYRNGNLTSTLNYLLHDHLGSIDVITNKIGQIQQELSFDPWGQRRNASSWQALTGNALSLFNTEVTTRGFTGHEMVDGVGFIHMNGRIYDPKLARFLQADPHIQAPHLTQNLNRYSYVLNNPLNATDPTGYFFHFILQEILVQAFYFYVLPPQMHGMFNAAVTIVGSSYCGPAAAACAAGIAGHTSFHSSYSQTGDVGEAAKASIISAVTTYISAQVFSYIGGKFNGIEGSSAWNAENGILHIGAHATAGGVLSVLQGGKFGHGFVSAGVSKALTPAISEVKTGLSVGSKDLGQALIAGTVGGTVSKMTGGKFSNGAITAAFANLFNDQRVDEEAEKGQIDLTEHEGINGSHTIRNHVGKSDQFLLYQMNESINIGAVKQYRAQAGSFSSLESANKLVSSTLSTNQELVNQFLASGEKTLVLNQRFSSSTGRVAFRKGNLAFVRPGRVHFTRGTGVRVVIRRNESFSSGFNVHTAFPTK